MENSLGRNHNTRDSSSPGRRNKDRSHRKRRHRVRHENGALEFQTLEVQHFFESYKDLEKKEVEVLGWEGQEAAFRYIRESIERFVAETDWPAGVQVTCVDTGEDTPTGGRIARVRDQVGEGTFCATYADGLADIDLRELARFHRDHGTLATITVGAATIKGQDIILDGGSTTKRLVDASADDRELVELPVPQPKANEAVVKLAASGVNFIDVYFR